MGPLSNGTRYYWHVNATNVGGTSLWSATWSFTTIVAPPAVPSLASPANASGNQPTTLTLSWNASGGATSYRLRVALDTGFTSVILDDGTLTGTSRQVGPLSNGTTYHWRVNATNTGGTSLWSATWSFTTIVAPPASPALISPADEVKNLSVNVTLYWNRSAGAASYRCQISTDPIFTTTSRDSTTADTSLTVVGLIANTTYHWRVNATNTGGTSSWSTVWSFTTIALPSAPTLLSPGNGATNVPSTATLVWDESPTTLTYTIQVARDSLFANPVQDTGGVTATSVTVGGLESSTLYRWRVAASNAAGSSPWSESRRFTTAPYTVGVSVDGGWNLVSVPVAVANYSTSAVFPTATSSAFAFNGTSYRARDTLANGEGYWVKFGTVEVVSIGGTEITSDTIHLRAKWNIVGTTSLPIAVSSIGSSPPGFIVSSFWGYRPSGYVTADTLFPGNGYWVKAKEAGDLVLSTHGGSMSTRVRIEVDGEEPPPPPGEVPSIFIPHQFALWQNYPNPFNPSTTIAFDLPEDAFVTVTVSNVLGQRVETVVEEWYQAGRHEVTFSAATLPSGVYLYRFSAGSFTQTRKMVILK